MIRTTEKYTHYEEYMSNVPENAHHAINAVIYEELYKLENIEEELGIDLIKAVELCKQVNSKKVVYTKENWGIGTLEFLDDLDIELFNHRLYVSARGMYISLDLYEYGKTRSISREELEQ